MTRAVDRADRKRDRESRESGGDGGGERGFGLLPLPPGTVIHILKHGFPLCRFSDLAPIFWPSGHIWVSWVERDVDHANCTGCVQGLKDWKREWRMKDHASDTSDDISDINSSSGQ